MKKIFTLFVLLLSTFVFYSQNDECANAIVLTPSTDGNVYTTGSFSGATTSTPTPNCAGASLQDVWYKFVATDPSMSIYVANNQFVNSAFEIYQDNCSGAFVTCQNFNGTGLGESYFSSTFTVGQTYYVRVLNADASFSAQDFKIYLQKYPAPANNECANATTLTPTTDPNSYVIGTFSGATTSTPTPNCAGASLQDVWYKFVATDPSMSIYVANNQFVNSAFEIYQDNCSGSFVTCQNFNGTGLGESYFSSTFTVGQTYYVRVLNADASFSAQDFKIYLQKYPAPANNECANATTLTPTTDPNSYVIGTFSGATTSTPTPNCAGASLQDVWYKFVATDPSMSIYVATNQFVNSAFEIYQDNCSGSFLTCQNFNGTGLGESYFSSTFTVGQTYYVRVLNAEASFSAQDFKIYLQKYPAPSNDQCANAITLTTATTCNPTTGTFNGASINTTAPACATSASQDVWYKFIATDTTMNISLTASTNTDNGFEILEGSCTGTSTICQNGNGSNIGEFYNPSNFTVGQTYYIRVFNANANLSIASFTICVYGQIQPCSPSINISASQSTTFCAGTTATFTAVPTNGGTTPIYQWKVNDINKGTNSDTFITNTLANNDTVTCLLTSNAPCAATANTATSNSITVTVNPLPTVNITYTNQILTATPGYTTYQWSFGGNNIQGAATNTYTPTQTGEYTVVVTNTNACTATATYNVTSLSTNAYNKPKFNIYPNPANSSINIQVNNDSTIDKVIITDLTGKKVIEQKSNSHQVNVQHLQQGVYIIQVLSDGKIFREKIIKE